MVRFSCLFNPSSPPKTGAVLAAGATPSGWSLWHDKEWEEKKKRGIRQLRAAVSSETREVFQWLCAHTHGPAKCWLKLVRPLGCEEQNRAEQSRGGKRCLRAERVRTWQGDFQTAELFQTLRGNRGKAAINHCQISIEIHIQGSCQWYTTTSRSVLHCHDAQWGKPLSSSRDF